jgi:hypothetical protein
VRSASRLLVAVLGLSLLAGCATTQQEAARLQLNDARTRASQVPLVLGARDPAARIAALTLIGGRDGAALVVRVRNLQPRPVTDLPILVGVSLPRRQRIYLNRAAGLDYFQTHVPLIAAHGELTWVFTTRRRLPSQARPFAEVGEAVSSAPAGAHEIPGLSVALARPTAGSGARLILVNHSSVPQYQLEVYGVAQRHGRYVAAGRASVEGVAAGATQALSLRLVGDPAGGKLSLEVPPTIFS